MEGWNMSYNATGNSAGRRISLLLDEGSFVEIGGAVTARTQISTCRKGRLRRTVSSPDTE